MFAEPFRSNCKCSLPNCINACCEAIEGTLPGERTQYANISSASAASFPLHLALSSRSIKEKKLFAFLSREKALLRCKSAISAATAIFGLYNSAKCTSNDNSRRLQRVRGMSRYQKTHGVDARIGERLPQLALSQGAADTTRPFPKRR